MLVAPYMPLQKENFLGVKGKGVPVIISCIFQKN